MDLRIGTVGLSLAAVTLFTTAAAAQEGTFKFQDKNNRNTVTFVLDAPLETIELLRAPYVAVVPAGSRFAHGPAPTLREIGPEPLVGFRSDRSIEPVEASSP